MNFSIFVFLLFALTQNLSWASCATPDWAHWDFSKDLTDNQKKAFSEFFNSTPIFFLGEVIESNPKKENLWKLQEGKNSFKFRASILKIYKGSLKDRDLTFEYELRAQKPAIATPFANEEWIFAVQKTNEGKAEIRSSTCGGFGFPRKQKKLMKEFERLLRAEGKISKLGESCKEFSDCRENDCSHMDRPGKTGFFPTCEIAADSAKNCKCMCYGCH